MSATRADEKPALPGGWKQRAVDSVAYAIAIVAILASGYLLSAFAFIWWNTHYEPGAAAMGMTFRAWVFNFFRGPFAPWAVEIVAASTLGSGLSFALTRYRCWGRLAAAGRRAAIAGLALEGSAAAILMWLAYERFLH